MAQTLTEELKVLVTAEVSKAVAGLGRIDKKADETEKMFRSLGRTISDAFSIGAVTAFMKKSVEAYDIQKEAVSILDAAIEATGAGAWTTSAQLKEMASSFQAVTNYGDEAVISMQSVLLGFKNIRGDTFNEASKAILDMSTVMHMDLASAAQAVGKALDDPVNGITSLQRQGFRFTAAQKDVIQSLIDTGDAAGAQKIILDELASTYGGAAEAARSSVKQIGNAWGDVLERVGRIFENLAERSGIAGTLLEGLTALADAANNFDRNFARLAGGSAYESWFESLDQGDRLKEAVEQTGKWARILDEKIASGTEADIQAAAEEYDAWSWRVRLLKDEIKAAQELAAAKNEELAVQDRISGLMHDVAASYDVMSKDDPAIRLKKYQQELERIASQRTELLAAPAGIDTSKALEQLAYLEKAIRQKMAAMKGSVQENWRELIEGILKVDASSGTGRDAARKYITGFENELEAEKKVSEILGTQLDMAGILERQKDDVRQALQELFATGVFDEESMAVDELIKEYRQLEEQIKDASPDENMTGWVQNLEKHLKELPALTEAEAVALTRVSEQMVNMGASSVLSGLETLGEALGEGADAGESLSRALADMATQILNQLPMMFLQAGLQLIAQGQWPVGLGFIAAAGASGVTGGIVKGMKADANAMGGVYGESGYEAFALGGTFTNQIVDSPTYFRFAKGSGFGTGLMGEAGPEAIMPLSRGADGSLGVSVNGGFRHSTFALTVNINNYSGEEVTAEEKQDEDGNRTLEITVGAMINQHITSGQADKAMKARYGLAVSGY